MKKIYEYEADIKELDAIHTAIDALAMSAEKIQEIYGANHYANTMRFLLNQAYARLQNLNTLLHRALEIESECAALYTTCQGAYKGAKDGA